MASRAAVLEIPGLTLEHELGRGSHSVVYRACRGDRPCAVKIAQGATRTARWFRREAAALARVCHEGVPQVLEVGEVGGRPYLVMELVEGETLATRLDARRLTQRETLALGLRLASIARAIHARGLIHRDIKPHNIVIDHTGAVCLVDFGLVTHSRGALTDMAGTRRYAAPEQLHSPHLVDARADLFAIGRVLLECLDVGADATAAPLFEIATTLAAELPQDRYPSAAALVAELERVQAGLRPRGVDRDCPVTAAETITLVGRDAERKHLEAAWERARAGRGRVLLLEGAPGSGKSRLLREFSTFVGPPERVLHLEAVGGFPAPLASLRQLVEQHISALETLPADLRAKRVAAWCTAARGPAARLVATVSPALAALIGEPTPPAEREHDAFVEAMAATLVNVARAAGPVLLRIDDLQWLDPVSREVLVRVALEAADVPLLVVAAARTDARSVPPVERFIRTLGQDRLAVLSVRGLTDADLMTFIAAYLGTSTSRLDPALTRRVVGLSDGTPLATLAILDALIDAGALRPHWGLWHFDADSAERIPLPRGASALLHRRLETLPPATLRVLQTAAVIGPDFETGRLAEVLDVAAEDLGHAFFEARRAGLADVDGGGRPRFVHDSIRETLLASLEASTRRALHQQVARVLDTESQRDPTVLFAAANHYAQGEPKADPDRVYVVARAAAEQALASLDHELALSLFDLACSTEVALDVRFHLDRAECRIRCGLLDEALASLNQALSLADDEKSRSHVLARLAWAYQLKSDAAQAWVCLDRAFTELGESMPSERPSVVARTMLRSARYRLGAHDADDGERLDLLCTLHYQNARLGVEYDRPVRTLQSAVAILAIGEQRGRSVSMVLAQGMYAMFMTVLGRHRAGTRYMNKAEVSARAMDDPACMARTLQFACMVECFGGNMDRALERGHECLGTYGPWFDVTDYCLLSRSLQLIESMRGHPREALELLERSLSRVRRQGDPQPAVRQIIIPDMQAVLATLGREETPGLRQLDPDSLRFEELRGFYRLVSWGARARRFAEADYDDEAVERLVRAFERERHNPRRVHLGVVEYYVCIAHVRARQCLASDPRSLPAWLRKLDRALADLRKAARIPLFRAHLLALDGWRALFAKEEAKAWARFRDAKALGEQETAPWVLYTVARGEAHLLRREGREEAARDQAQIAAVLARAHGAVNRLRWIEQEFGLEPLAPERPSQGTGSRGSFTTIRHRQLRALLDVVRATAREQEVEPQARAVLDELLRLAHAWRGLVLFERDGAANTRVLIGREHGENDWAPSESDWHDRLQRVLDTGEAEVPGQAEDAHAVMLPLELHEVPVGALYLERREGDAAFGSDDVELLTTLTPQVATTLELARLLEERERLQASLRQAQKMEAVGQLASGIAHDFNNSLMAISSAASELDRHEPLASREHDLIDIIKGASDRAARLTRQLLAYSRRQVLEFTKMDVGASVEGLAPMLRRLLGNRIELILRPPENPCWVKTDRTSFENAILNLAVNARDAMPKGGTLTISVNEVELDESWIPRGASRAGAYACISVEDTGTGIPPEIIDRIFDPFYTTKGVGDGTGLGLASVYGFVKQSGGCVDVYSKVGVGSEFSVYLPSVEAEATVASVASSAARPLPSSRPATILLVDDEPLVRRALERTLQAGGYVVRTAANGADALERIRTEGAVDLIVADVLMPVLSGPELANRLAAAGIEIPLLFISGYPDATLVDQGVLRPGVEFLQKPFDNQVLRARVADLLARTRGRVEAASAE